MAGSDGKTEEELLKHIEQAYVMDTPLEVEKIEALLAKAPPGGLSWELQSEDGLPCLHLAAMNSATDPESQYKAVVLLLQAGAPPDALDEDQDTALEAVLSLTSEEEEEEITNEAKLAALATVRALLPSLQPLKQEQVVAVVSWLRRYMLPKPEAEEAGTEEECERLRETLEKLIGKEAVNQAWASEELLEYLEKRACDLKLGVDSSVVRSFLDKGASPSQSQNGATALLLTVLNPYSKLEELEKVFSMMLQKDPSVAAACDGFRLTPLQWASDYTNVAQQHGLREPNPAVLLALLPALVTMLPPDIDAGEACFKVDPKDNAPRWRPERAPATRFMEGDRVICRVETPGGGTAWEEGVIIGLWYRERCWPKDHPGAPYDIRLDIGSRVFALVDHDRIVRKEGGAPPPAPRPVGAAPTAKAKAAAGKRFVRRMRDDGEWEMLDTVSGKARPCSPPDSDEEC